MYSVREIWACSEFCFDNHEEDLFADISTTDEEWQPTLVVMFPN